ncbi:hypothetical protein HCH_04794 [Hahella chejuensis KCTC 2396]|uniref:Uncharacterized protein n=1 Tax=Hahella chejuensis (strain KCTC 2396) TaxID=349521 RepID=Q2SCY6_HAHCH|nr:hypothetical protein HCH_04794 [Hahella chejuensis KCTC 2396]
MSLSRRKLQAEDHQVYLGEKVVLLVNKNGIEEPRPALNWTYSRVEAGEEKRREEKNINTGGQPLYKRKASGLAAGGLLTRELACS